MKDKLAALEIEGFGEIAAPSNIPTGGVSEFNRISTVFLNLFVLGGVLLTLFFIAWGGVRWITSGGDKNKVESARKTITFSIIGLIVIVFSFILIRVIGQIIRSPFLTNFGR